MKWHHSFNIFLLFCFLVVYSGCAKYKVRRSSAFDHIEMLRQNTLLVRLKSEDKKIAALQKANRQTRIEKTKARLQKENTAIINAFKNNFKFSKFYFFYANEAKLLRNQKYHEITLYDIHHQPVPDNSFIENGYLIAALDYIHEFEFVGENDTIRKVVSATFGYPSLVLMDKDFIQLSKPFPRRILNRGGDLLDPEEVVMLDLQLFKFYKRLNRLKARKPWLFEKKREGKN